MTKSRTEYHRQWRADNRDKVTAARIRFGLRHPYVPKTKLKDPTGRLITVRQEQIYRLVHPDFYNLPYWAAAKVVGVCAATICNELKRIKKMCPTLFPLYVASPAVGRWHHGMNDAAVSYENWMDDKIIQKF